jgi:hypothetical protein
MNDRKRQLIVLVGFMALLAVAAVFLLTQNALQSPAEGAGNQTARAAGGVLGPAVEGWAQLIQDLSSLF